MSGEKSDDANESWYTRHFEPPRFPEEAYGYWMSVTGLVLSLLAVAFLLLETTAGDGTPLFWTARQAAAVFAGAGFPLIVLGFVYRLPVGTNVHRLAFMGAVVCLVALVLFVRAYPDGWGVNPDSPAADLSFQIVAVYAVGLFLTVSSATVLPTVTRRQEVIEESPAESDAEFELFRDVSADWRWRLLDGDGGVVAESDKGYPSEKAAERSLEGFREEVDGASVETRDVLEEQMLSEEATAVEKEAGHTKTPEIETRGEDARFELRECEGGWRWSLRDGEGNALGSSSDTYEDPDGAEATAEAVRDIADEAGVVDAEPAFVAVHRDEAGDWRWGLRDVEGNVLASPSEAYEDRDGVDTALERLTSGEGVETEILEESEEDEQEEGGWRWRLVHTNSEVLAVSPVYEDRGEAEEAAETAEKLLAEAESVEAEGGYFAVHREDTEGWVWSLHDEGGEKIAVPGGPDDEPRRHGDKDEALTAVERVRRRAPGADISG